MLWQTRYQNWRKHFNDKSEANKKLQLIEQNLTQSDLSTKEQFCDTLNKVNTKFKTERKRLEDDFSSLEKQLDNMDNFAMETRKKTCEAGGIPENCRC